MMRTKDLVIGKMYTFKKVSDGTFDGFYFYRRDPNDARNIRSSACYEADTTMLFLGRELSNDSFNNDLKFLLGGYTEIFYCKDDKKIEEYLSIVE